MVNGDGDHGIGNAGNINVMARWTAKGEKGQVGVSFYKLFKCLSNVLYTRNL